MQAYSNPKRQNDPYALPNVEVFYMGNDEIMEDLKQGDTWINTLWADYSGSTKEFIEVHTGFYYWDCFPGCLPDSDPIGPFETKEQALSDAQSES